MSNNKKFYWLNKDSRTFLSRGYLDEGIKAEDRIREIADSAEKILGIEGFSDKFYSYMEKGFYSLSSPVWSNFGNKKGSPVSCFGSYVEDFMESILDKNGEVGTMSKIGGGTSGFFGELRPRGSSISAGGKSSGPVHFLELFDKTSSVINQGGVRRGAFAAYLPVEHPDIMEFLEIREEHHPIQDISIGVTISDKWMEEMLNGDKGKRKIWARIVRKRYETGYPYIFFSDTVNNNKPEVYKDKGMDIKASNLCVAPETLLLTKSGHIPIAHLEGEMVDIWNGEEWSNVRVEKTAKNQKLYKVRLDDGKYIECTDYHKWYVVESYWDQTKGTYKEKRTFELKEGDKLIKFSCPVIDGNESFESPYTHGFFCGDGTYDVNRAPIIWLYGEKKNLIKHLDIRTSSFKEDASGRIGVRLNRTIAPKFQVPLRSSVDVKIKWLEGYLDADGTITRNGKSEAIQVISTEYEFLKEVQLLLQTLGVNCRIAKAMSEGDMPMPDGKGGTKIYHCRETNRILITPNGLHQLSLLGFSPKRLKFSHRLPTRDAALFTRVVSVEDEGRVDDTYCLTESKRGMAIFNGVLTGNCSEIALPSNKDESFVCVLSSLNLLHWEEIIKTDAIETLIYFLDAVNEEFIQKTEGNKYLSAANRFAKRHRALGLGVLGWHSLLQSKMIPFESMGAKFLNNQIWSEIQKRTLEASTELAKILGEPEVLKGYGRRNTCLTTVAPTTSSSFILGQVSPSIEPLRSNYFIKELAKGSFSYRNPYLEQLLEIKGQNNEKIWLSILKRGGSIQHLDFLTQEEKNVFKTFGEISQKEIVIQAAQRQKYIDQSQSLNILVPPKVKGKDVSDLLIFGWENGIKTFYYQRSANPSQELAMNINSCSSCEG